MIKPKKLIKRGAIKVMKRGKLLGNFIDQAKNMTKQQLIEHISLIQDKHKQDNPTYVIARRFLERVYGMSDEEINKAVMGIRENRYLKQDVRSYYRGDATPEEIISKWGHKGLSSKSDVDMMAMEGTYEVPGRLNNPKKIKEHYSAPGIGIGNIRTSPEEMGGLNMGPSDKKNQNLPPQPNIVTSMKSSGQRSFVSYGHALYNKYREFDQYLSNEVRNGRMSNSEKRENLNTLLLSIADERPEFAAHVSYIVNGGDIHDDFNSDIFPKYIGHFGKPGTKESFIRLMQLFKLNRSRNPVYRKMIEVYLNDNDMSAKRVFTETGKSPNPSGMHKYTGHYEKMDSDVVGKSDDNVEINRRKRRKKLLSKRYIKKKPIKKIIKKKIVKKCRCK
jgi:hypothetical protein